jgi:hypothetical protein
MKTVLTESLLYIDGKNQQERVAENCAHILATSNDANALDLDQYDRRWLIVRTTEKRWTDEEFAAFRAWAFDGIGCNIILAEARKYADKVTTGRHAPSTPAKMGMVFQTKGDADLAVESFNESVGDQLVAVPTGLVLPYLKELAGGQTVTLQKSYQKLKKLGWAILNQTDTEFGKFRPELRVGGSVKQTPVIVSPKLKHALVARDQSEWAALIQPHLKNMADAADAPFGYGANG